MLYNMFAAQISEKKRERKLFKVTSNRMHQLVRYSVSMGFMKSHILSCPELFNSTLHANMTPNSSGRPPAAAALSACSGLFKPNAANTEN